MKYLVTALLVLTVGTFSVVAEKANQDKELFGHINKFRDGPWEGFRVVVFDESTTVEGTPLEGTLRFVAESHLRAVGIPVSDESLDTVVCAVNHRVFGDNPSTTYDLECVLGVCLRCSENNAPHCGVSIYETGSIGTVRTDNFLIKMGESIGVLIDEIANEILKYRPDLREN